ncbi:MAG: hypothetical protein ACNI3A_02825 [Desulfovibrio sp.]|uniref:hypothetical protein n=1 Tax=Desulfovibrio sp. 7SRBS1 TaxID=3378064 RepID=UPI003B3C8EDC
MAESETPEAMPKRFWAQHKTELLRGEDIKLVSREVGRTAAKLSRWKEAFLAVGEQTMEIKLL